MKSLNNIFFVYEYLDQTYSSIIIGKIVANCCCNLTVLSCNLMNGFVAFLLNCGIVFYFVYNRKNYPSILKRQLFTLLNWCNILIVGCLRFLLNLENINYSKSVFIIFNMTETSKSSYYFEFDTFLCILK